MTSMPPRSFKRLDRRKHERTDVDAPARLLSGTAALNGKIENVGSGGVAFVTTDLDPELSAGTLVTLVAPGAGDEGGDLELQARVIRVDKLCDVSGESHFYALGFDRPIDT